MDYFKDINKAKPARQNNRNNDNSRKNGFGETEEEEEEKEKKEAEQQQKINNNRMMLTHPNSFSPVPINFGLNAGIGEYGSAIGQSLLSYHPNL